MNQYSVFVAVCVAMAFFLANTSSASTVPMINCEPNVLNEASTKVRQLCYYVLEQLKADQPQDNAEPIDSRLYERGTKRQDVDHVFLRFGRRFGF